MSWRPVFYVNLPIGLLMIAAAHFTLPRRPRPRIPADAIDWIGIRLLIGALGSLALGLMQTLKCRFALHIVAVNKHDVDCGLEGAVELACASR